MSVGKYAATLLWCLIAWLCLEGNGRAASARYERAKEALARLETDPRQSRMRAPWERLAAEFLNVYNKERHWRDRPAALFRSAVALDGLARRSGRRADALNAVKRYLLLVRRHKKSVLADDALYRAAVVHQELLRDKKGAHQLLRQQLSAYPAGNRAVDASVRLSRKRAPKPPLVGKITSQQNRAKKKAIRNGVNRRKKASRFHAPAITVLLDAGHGGSDPGTGHNGILERRVTLDLVKRVGSRLTAKGFRVRYTRYDNRDVSLDRRADMVRSAHADLFVSIHVNAHRTKAMHGLETYHLDFGRVSPTERRRAVENALRGRSASVRQKVSPQKLFVVQKRETRRLARTVHRALLSSLKQKKFTVRDGGIKSAPLYVLRRCGVPGILVEVGYCTNKKEAQRLARRDYRAALARGLADGIARYAYGRGR